ncbi:MAG: hypothetical protein JW993_05685 [Sedimentisphaerales bacterium]|nr:hypothetical protein [Sedimentisphaerales bacterium]
MGKKESTNFEELAKKSRSSLPVEFVIFLKYNKKWWLLPIVVVLLLLGLVILLAGTSAAPFIYTIF